MKYLFVFLLVGLTFNSFGQNRYHIDETTLNDSGLALQSTNQAVTGVVYSSYENCHIKEENSYNFGRLDGLSRFWYENGQLAYQGNYNNGAFISEKCWDEEGNEIECEGP